MKKKTYLLGNVALFVLTSFVTCAYEDYEFDDLDAFTDTLEWHPTIRQADDVTPQVVLDFIASPPILLQDRLQNDLYLFTYPGNRRRRSLLDYPFDTLHANCWLLGGLQCNGWMFYNQTSADNYTAEGINITSYWNLNNANIIRDIDLTDFGIDIPNVLDLFGILRMQERRSGFMFGGYYIGEEGWNLEIKFPIYYYERNFFLNEEEKMRLENSIVFDEDGSGKTDDEEMRKQFMSDALGIGDTRLSAGLLVVNEDRFKLNVGAEFTIPTGFAFHNGFLGSFFPKNSEHAPFNFLEIFQLASMGNLEAVKEISIDFISSIFDKLSANLVQVSMGNSRHFGMAAFFENLLPLNRRFTLTTRGAAEYLMPASEKRFYITKKFPQEFIALEPYTTDEGADPAQAPFKLAFLNEQFINTFIPMVFDTDIYPGFLVKFTSEITGYFGYNWTFGVGYDLWWQDKEKLGSIKTDAISIADIRTEIVARPGAFQNKIFGTVNYANWHGRWFDWCLTAYADCTILSYGIGKDFTLAFRFTADI